MGVLTEFWQVCGRARFGANRRNVPSAASTSGAAWPASWSAVAVAANVDGAVRAAHRVPVRLALTLVEVPGAQPVMVKAAAW